MANKRQTSGRRQHERVTASDVARLAGVSPMTVSRVVNGETSVRESTRIAVERAIKQLGYSPNKAARSLASASPIKIGLLYSDPSSTFLTAMLLGMLEQARRSDTQIVVVACDDGPEAMGVVQGMIENGVDGILLAPPLCDSVRLFRVLREEDMPGVTIGASHPEEGCSSVSIDDYQAALTMTRHLLSLGHERIGFLVGTPEQSASQLRLKGFRAGMQEAGLEVDESLIVQGVYSYRSGFDGADQLLNLENPPSAIFACNDDMAAGAIAMAHWHRIEVPRDLTVVGFDDTMMATASAPEITTIRQPIADMSAAAIELLVRNIRQQRNGAGVKLECLDLDYRLVARGSDSPPGSEQATGRQKQPQARVARRFRSSSSRKPPAR